MRCSTYFIYSMHFLISILPRTLLANTISTDRERQRCQIRSRVSVKMGMQLRKYRQCGTRKGGTREQSLKGGLENLEIREEKVG